ncbi:MAG: hypothetical protein P4L82_03425, partial [Ancalomicrobiaceae bacterium]|nr:hypothetical protein [Ancalomicrobiaceae bacterium]
MATSIALSETLAVVPLTRRLRGLLPLALAIVVALGLVAAAGWYGYRHSFDQAVEEIRGRADHRLDLYAASFEREIEKFAAFPFVMSYDRNVADLVAAPDDPERAVVADRYLERLNARIGTLAVYILDKTGRCIASSN